MFDERKYQETFAQVHASEKTLSEVLKLTKKRKTGTRVTRMLVIAAIISAMMATTAFAYVGFTQYENPMVMLKTFFGKDEYSIDEGTIFTYQDEYYYQEYQTPTVENVPLDEEVAAEVGEYISDVGESITHDGNTITVEAHQHDSATQCGIIYYTVENPDGVTGYELQYDGEVWWPGGELVCMRHASGMNYIIPEETTDTKLSVAFYYGAVTGDSDCIEVCFYADKSIGLYLPLDDGGGIGNVKLGDGAVVISAIGMRIFAENMDFLRETDPDGVFQFSMVDNIRTVTIRYLDGSEYIVEINTEENETRNYMYAVQDMSGTTVSYTFNRLVDVDNVEAVLINDVEFALDS